MKPRRETTPLTFLFLALPYGISGGFVSVTLPYSLVDSGFSVAMAASVVAVGSAANLWRFLWGPIADLTLTARRWYLLGLAAAAATMLLLALVPLRPEAVASLMAMVFISQVAGTLIALPVGGLMAHTVADGAKGRAAGWFQAGNLGGTGLGGGAGIWLVTTYGRGVGGAILALAMFGSAAAISFVPDVRIVSTETVGERLRLLGRDLRAMVRSALPLFTIVLVATPIGAGAMSNLWSAVAADWNAGPDRVALVTGILNGAVSAIGSVAGGWLADRAGRWWAFFTSGASIAFVALGMAAIARTPATYTAGVLVYSFLIGVCYSSFSAVVLFAIGRGAASTKYATLSSFGNIPVVYMTALNGWVHDRSGTEWMLVVEAVVTLASIAIALAVLRALTPRRT